jgi:hypothetical protein
MDSPYRHLGSFVKTEDGIRAVRYLTKLAEQQGIACAVCGGLLMHLYGFTRATQQVDLVASQTLSLTPHKPLSFGGHAYTVTIDGQPHGKRLNRP